MMKFRDFFGRAPIFKLLGTCYLLDNQLTEVPELTILMLPFSFWVFFNGGRSCWTDCTFGVLDISHPFKNEQSKDWIRAEGWKSWFVLGFSGSVDECVYEGSISFHIPLFFWISIYIDMSSLQFYGYWQKRHDHNYNMRSHEVGHNANHPSGTHLDTIPAFAITRLLLFSSCQSSQTRLIRDLVAFFCFSLTRSEMRTCSELKLSSKVVELDFVDHAGL